MKYVKIEWPEIQEYMEWPEFKEECHFDPNKNVWFIPDWWESEHQLEMEFTGGDKDDFETVMEE